MGRLARLSLSHKVVFQNAAEPPKRWVSGLHVWIDAGTVVAGVVENVSTEGLLVRVAHPVERGARVVITVFHRERQITVRKAVVAHTLRDRVVLVLLGGSPLDLPK